MSERILIVFLSVVFGIFCQNVIAQVGNDECLSATHLTDLDDFCTDVGGIDITQATPSVQPRPSCWPAVLHDLWFTFTASTPGIFIQLNGATQSTPGGTLNQPQLALYQGDCNGLTEVRCASDAVASNTIEQIATDLMLGQTYYIRIGARNNNTGTLQLCIDAFIPSKDPSSDCPTAVILCDKSPFIVEQLSGTGNIADEADDSCLDIDPSTGSDDGNSEKSSSWYTWTCFTPGTLTFTLTPNGDDVTEDLDFALYELPNGIGDCSGKILLRCMASGENVGAPFAEWEPCTGPTGLRNGETDIREERGCSAGDNNFLAPLNMEEGKSYALIVNNFSQTGRGFSIEFGGTGSFLGPEPDFEIEAVEAFECDKTVIFTNLSGSETDSIISWTWQFGAGANPGTVNGPGPHSVIYASFGDKVAALTVETSRGCSVTRIIQLFVEPCCADTSTLDLDAAAVDLICPGVNTGSITATGMQGAPAYQYSLTGMNFQPAPIFPNLGPGEYTVYVQDEKGCRDSIIIDVEDAPLFTVDAGDTLHVDLGSTVQLNAVPFPNNFSTVDWSPAGSLTFGGNPLSPVALPPGTTTYTVTVTNEAGCVASDDVLVQVNIVRPVYIPNVFSPNNDGINDRFTVYAGPAADFVESLQIYSRWGELVFENSFTPNDELAGWDGTFNGQLVNPGVFTYLARVHFLDQKVVNYAGTVTVLR